MTAVSVQGVTKRFGDFTAVDALSFEVPKGIIYGVLGPNGAGKSTTLRMLNDIIAPDDGQISLLGELKPGRAAAARIGYLPEERGLYPKMRVGDTLTFFSELRGIHRKRARELAGQWLERLGLSAWWGKRVNELSKGMQQKVQFASAFLHEPELVILDEPWSGLDPINAEVLRDVVLSERERGTTILFSTHLMEQAEKICERVCIIAGGRQVLEGEIAALRRDAASEGLVSIRFASEADIEKAMSGACANRELVANTRRTEQGVELQLQSEASADALLASLVAEELAVRHFELIEPTLHQIFVDRVGAEAAARNPEAS